MVYYCHRVMGVVLMLMIMLILLFLVVEVLRTKLMVILVSLLTDDWSAHPEIRHVTPRTSHSAQFVYLTTHSTQ